MPHEIRRLNIADYPAMIKVWSDAGLPYKPLGRESRASLQREIANPDCAFYGLFDGSRLLGVCIANWDGRRGWINRLAIDPDFRGKGLAAKLIASCEQFLEAHGATVIAALIDEENLPSMATFTKSGYECLSEIKYFAKRKSADA
jgi:ribosomal protein S18 acetylase RimI-like enzyme